MYLSLCHIIILNDLVQMNLKRMHTHVESFGKCVCAVHTYKGANECEYYFISGFVWLGVMESDVQNGRKTACKLHLYLNFQAHEFTEYNRHRVISVHCAIEVAQRVRTCFSFLFFFFVNEINVCSFKCFHLQSYLDLRNSDSFCTIMSAPQEPSSHESRKKN